MVIGAGGDGEGGGVEEGESVGSWLMGERQGGATVFSVRTVVRADTVGDVEGDKVGSEEVGELGGDMVGEADGWEVDGDPVGEAVGVTVGSDVGLGWTGAWLRGGWRQRGSRGGRKRGIRAGG